MDTNQAVHTRSQSYFLSAEELSKKTSKTTKVIMETIQQKTELSEKCKNETQLLLEAKKLCKEKIEHEKSKTSIYKEKFDKFMSELGQELVYDPIEGAIVAEENAKLKARAENLSKEVESMDNDYKSKIEGLSKPIFKSNFIRTRIWRT